MVDMRFMKNIVDNAMGTTNKVAKSAPVQKSKVRKYDNENEEFEFSDITFGESFSVDSDYGRLEFWTNGPQEGRTQSYFTGNIPHLDVGITIDITVEKIDGYTCKCSYVENYYNYETGKEVEYDNGTCDGEINRDGKITSIYGIYVDFGIEEVTKSKKSVKSKAKKSKVRKDYSVYGGQYWLPAYYDGHEFAIMVYGDNDDLYEEIEESYPISWNAIMNVGWNFESRTQPQGVRTFTPEQDEELFDYLTGEVGVVLKSKAKKSKVKKDEIDDYIDGYNEASASRKGELKKMMKILEKMSKMADDLVSLDSDWGTYEMDSLKEDIDNKIYWMRQEINDS